MSTPQELFNEAVRFHQAGNVSRAERLYRQIIDTDPTHSEAFCNLGVALAQQGRHEEALGAYQTAVQMQPNYPDARFNMGNACRALNRLGDAAKCYQGVLQLEPEHLGATFNLGLVWWGLGRWEEARDCFEAALQIKPDLVEARNHLGYTFHRLNRLPEAIATYRSLLKDNPNYVRGYHNLGLALSASNRHDEAEECFREALRIQPDYAEAHNSYGVTLEALGRPDEAMGHYERAVQLKPTFGDALNNLGIAYTEVGRHDEAIECRRMALELEPEKAHVHSNMLLTMNYSADITPEELHEEHKNWAAHHADLFTAIWHGRAVDWNPKRKLRLGYVSADFRQHTVASFLKPLLANHDHERVHVTCFSNVRQPDEVTKHLKGYADGWVSIFGINDAAAAAMIRENQIDILIDLSGHTAGNRLLVFAQKPAPIQVTHFGYPNTTGMTAMDYRISDEHSDPPGETESFYTEQLLRLPEVPWVYEPPQVASGMDVGPSPLDLNGHVTFASTNNPAKLTTAMIRTWVSILGRIPDSRLLVLVGRNGFGTAHLRERFAEAGLSGDRVEFVPRLPAAEYFALYQRADILFDTSPYNGGVTSCDAFWMGVPMVTIAGRTYVSRQGSMLCHTLGLGDLVAGTPDEYADMAVRLANEPDRLRELRAGLRENLKRSPLMRPKQFVEYLEGAYREVWSAQSKPR